MKYLSIVLLLSLSACASKPLTQQESAIRMLKHSDPDRSCKQLGSVKSYGYSAFTPEAHEDNLRREAAKLGANTVTLDRVDANNTTFGTAWNCNTGGAN